MRIAALADLHLGYRSFPATISGRNAREVDVEIAWAQAVDQVIAAGVDLVTIAGDIFHHLRVSDHARLAFLRGVKRLLEAGCRVVILQGNHDGAKTADVLTPIMLAEVLGERLHLVMTPKRIKLDFLTQHSPDPEDVTHESVSVACFPYVTRSGDGGAYRLEPDPDADVNILLMHAAVRGDSADIPYFYGGGGALDIDREAGAWDVIALGDFHEHRRFGDGLAFYSGSLERTSSNIWQEHEPKGWVLVDTEAGTAELQEVETRRMIDFDLGDFDHPPGVGAEDLNAVLAEIHEAHALEGAIVRFKIDAFPREERGEVDWKLVREIKKTCLHFELDLRYAKREVEALGDRRERGEGGLSLADELAAFTEGMDPGVRKLMADYMGVELPEEVPA